MIGSGQQNAASAEEAIQGGEAPRDFAWAEVSVWTKRMLSALGNGVKGGRWYALVDKVFAPNTLAAAWTKVRANKGVAGVDGQSIERFAARAEEYLAELSRALREGSYRPQAVKRVDIPKGDGRTRPLGIPTVKDRIVQQAVRLVIEPIFEAGFHDGSYGFRPGRGCHDALREVDRLIKDGYAYVVDADLAGYLDVVSYYPLAHAAGRKRLGCGAKTLMRSPFCLPRITWTASSSPRLTRCNTVWRDRPSARMASRIGRKSSDVSLLKRALSSSVRRMRQGAPGVSCSPAIMPSLSKRWIVEERR